MFVIGSNPIVGSILFSQVFQWGLRITANTMLLHGIEEVSTTSDSTAFWGFESSNLHFLFIHAGSSPAKAVGIFEPRLFCFFCTNLVKYCNESF